METNNNRKFLQEFIDFPCNSTTGCQPCMNCKEDKKRIIALLDEGHTYHCAVRIMYGDGECECKRKTKPSSVNSVPSVAKSL